MRPLALLLVAAAALLAGCNPPRPWQGITPAEFARVDGYRQIGIAYLENEQFKEALPEFEALRKAQSGLAIGHVNVAVVLMRYPGREAEVLKEAQKGVELLPSAAWPRLVLSHAYRRITPPQSDKAVEALEAAVRLEPDNPRLVGELLGLLGTLPGDHSQRVHELAFRLAELAPRNLAALEARLRAENERKEWGPARETLDRFAGLLPRMTGRLQETYATARARIATPGPDTSVSLLQFLNVLKQSPQYVPDRGAVLGSTSDPANLIMRDWGSPPPSLPAPPLKDVTVTWTDATVEAGLADVKAPGTAPLAVGDVDLSPDAGKFTSEGLNPLQDRPDLALGAAGGVRLNQGGKFSGNALVAGPASPLLVDLNNDYTLDLYVATPDGDRLFRNGMHGEEEGSGGAAGANAPMGITFTRTAPGLMVAAPAPPAAKGSGAPLAVDLDQDGDLDILRASSAPDQPAVRYLRNNGNLTFTDLTKEAGLSLPSQRARQAVAADFDADGDPDVLIVRSAGPCQLFLNQRQDAFTNGTGAWDLKGESGAQAAAVGDFDRDGRWDVAMAGHAPHGTRIYRNTGAKFETQPLEAAGDDADWIATLDYDNDTWIDLVVAGAAGVKLLHNDHGRFTGGGPALSEASTWVKPLDYDLDGDLDLLAVTAKGRARLLRNEGGNGRPWVRLELQGLSTLRGQANNSYGIGAEVEPRTVYERQKVLMTDPVIHLGLGRAERAYTLRTLWTHGIPQDVIAPKTGAPVHFRQIPTGSCPFLYTWDGERWQFACDFNWRSPIGMLFARGVSVPHDQTADWVKLPADRMRATDGFYSLIATEELREISYFDQIRLLALDHPAWTEVYVDERFHAGPPAPFEVYPVIGPRLPRSAVNEAGQDLLPALRTVDRVYTPVPWGAQRGVLAPHDLILDLGEIPASGPLLLFLNGWIYPAPNSTNVAAAQNPDLRVIPPTLSFGDGNGGWTGEDRSVGLPCGKRKTIVLDLTGKVDPHDPRVKLTTTMEIRWDAAFFTAGEAPAEVRRYPVPLVEADLRDDGHYGTHYREVPDGPDLFDYNRPLGPGRAPDWPPITGRYTRLGNCSPLLQDVDDRYAILGPGEEIRLRFDARKLPPLPAGWKRDFVLLSDGWTKDSDPNTVTGESVEPLPFHGMKRYPPGPGERFPDDSAHRAWIREWNTREKRR